jgi:hypothetical protein
MIVLSGPIEIFLSKKSATVLARLEDNTILFCNFPTLSVWPSTIRESICNGAARRQKLSSKAPAFLSS